MGIFCTWLLLYCTDNLSTVFRYMIYVPDIGTTEGSSMDWKNVLRLSMQPSGHQVQKIPISIYMFFIHPLLLTQRIWSYTHTCYSSRFTDIPYRGLSLVLELALRKVSPTCFQTKSAFDISGVPVRRIQAVVVQLQWRLDFCRLGIPSHFLLDTISWHGPSQESINMIRINISHSDYIYKVG